MPRFWRFTIILLGFSVVCFSLVILVFVLSPVETIKFQATIEPTLFVVP